MDFTVVEIYISSQTLFQSKRRPQKIYIGSQWAGWQAD
jgi:hypothetical protein